MTFKQRATTTSIRSTLSKCTGKICAYLNVDKIDEARKWASILQERLIEMGLLVDKDCAPVHNNTRTDNKTTDKEPADARR